MLRFFKLGFFNSLCCSIESSVSGFDFVDAAESASSDLLKDGVIF